MARVLAAVFLTTLVMSPAAGCTAPRHAAYMRGTQAELEDSETGEVCDYDMVTGSHFPDWRCRSEAQATREREAARRALTTPRQVSRPPPGAGGGP